MPGVWHTTAVLEVKRLRKEYGVFAASLGCIIIQIKKIKIYIKTFKTAFPAKFGIIICIRRTTMRVTYHRKAFCK